MISESLPCDIDAMNRYDLLSVIASIPVGTMLIRTWIRLSDVYQRSAKRPLITWSLEYHLVIGKEWVIDHVGTGHALQLLTLTTTIDSSSAHEVDAMRLFMKIFEGKLFESADSVNMPATGETSWWAVWPEGERLVNQTATPTVYPPTSEDDE